MHCKFSLSLLFSLSRSCSRAFSVVRSHIHDFQHWLYVSLAVCAAALSGTAAAVVAAAAITAVVIVAAAVAATSYLYSIRMLRAASAPFVHTQIFSARFFSKNERVRYGWMSRAVLVSECVNERLLLSQFTNKTSNGRNVHRKRTRLTTHICVCIFSNTML